MFQLLFIFGIILAYALVATTVVCFLDRRTDIDGIRGICAVLWPLALSIWLGYHILKYPFCVAATFGEWLGEGNYKIKIKRKQLTKPDPFLQEAEKELDVLLET